jgi:hypothetical protein
MTTAEYNPSRASNVAAILWVVCLIGAFVGLAVVNPGDRRIDCDSKFAVRPPASAEGIQCHSSDSYSAQWYFTMPTDEVEAWWAGQSEAPLDLERWHLKRGTDGFDSSMAVKAYYPEDGDSFIAVNPKPDGRSAVYLNGTWK